MKKIINRLFITVMITALISACNSFDLDLQDNPLAVTPEGASINDLWNSVQIEFAEFYEGTEFNSGATARMYHSGGFTYNAFTTPNTYNFAWNVLYSDILPDIDNILLLAEDAGLDVHAGAAKLIEAYSIMVAVDLFGDVPYSESGQGTDIISPNVDSGQDVYNAAIALIDEAIAQLTGTNAAAPAFDNFYDGDVAGWITFGNTLKLRAALNTGDASAINALIAGDDLITEASQDFQVNFGNQRTNPDSRHPNYINHYEIGDGDYLSNYYMWLMSTGRPSAITDGFRIDDPRRRYYFYRKVEDAFAQDATTYSCHHTFLPGDDAGSNLNHWDAIDPLLRETFCVLADGYSGRSHGNGQGIPPDGPTRTSYGLYPAGGEFDWDDFDDTRQEGTLGGSGEGIFPIMLSSFTDFMLAEAALTLGTTGDARALVESGIRKSMNKVRGFESVVPSTMGTQITETDRTTGETITVTVQERFGMTDADIDDYVTEVLAIYDAATSDQERLNVVITEYYLAAWGNGLEAYNMFRRTGLPANMQPTLESEPGPFPYTMFYAVDFVTRNSNVDTKGLEVRPFWMDAGLQLY